MDRNAGLDNSRIKDQNTVYDSLAGLIFLGTPQAGSDIVKKDRIKVLEQLARVTFKKPPKKLINALVAHCDEIERLSNDFQRITIFTRHEIEICSYYETVTTRFLGEAVSSICEQPGQ